MTEFKRELGAIQRIRLCAVYRRRSPQRRNHQRYRCWLPVVERTELSTRMSNQKIFKFQFRSFRNGAFVRSPSLFFLANREHILREYTVFAHRQRTRARARRLRGEEEEKKIIQGIYATLRNGNDGVDGDSGGGGGVANRHETAVSSLVSDSLAATSDREHRCRQFTWIGCMSSKAAARAPLLTLPLPPLTLAEQRMPHPHRSSDVGVGFGNSRRILPLPSSSSSNAHRNAVSILQLLVKV